MSFACTLVSTALDDAAFQRNQHVSRRYNLLSSDAQRKTHRTTIETKHNRGHPPLAGEIWLTTNIICLPGNLAGLLQTRLSWSP